MNNKVNLSLVNFLALAIVGCNWGQPNTTKENEVKESLVEKAVKEQTIKPDLKIIQLEKANLPKGAKVFTAKVSEKAGADLYFKIDPQSFNLKVNTNGTLAKTVADIDHYHVYLVKNAANTSYPLNGDPLGASDLVYGDFIIPNAGATTKNVRFTNVQSSGSDFYYVAVRAQDVGNNDLIKANNGSGTAWTGDTANAPNNGQVAVSTGAGISVDASLVVTPTTPLAVSANLLDGVGATIEATITPNPGTTGTTGAESFNTISLLAGTGTSGSTGDGGPAASAQLGSPSGIAVDSSGNVFIAELASRIRRVDNVTGNISTFAGTGTGGSAGDGGPAVSAQLNQAAGVEIDSSGNVFIADSFNNKIRRVDNVTGNISTFAGTGTGGSAGDGGPAASAQLSFPNGIAVDSSGNVFIAGFGNRIRRVDNVTGNISTIAGTGTSGSAGDGGPAASAQLSFPRGVAVDSSGNVFIADTANNKIRRVDNVTGNISTIAGNGTSGSVGDDGDATDAQLNFPTKVAIDSNGNIFIADRNNNKVRKVR